MSSRTPARVFVGLALLGVAVIGVWGAVGVTNGLRAYQQTNRIETAFDHARYALAIERTATRTQGPSALRELRAAQEQLAAELSEIRRHGTPADRARVRRIVPLNEELRITARRISERATAADRLAFESWASRIDLALTGALRDVRGRNSASWPAETSQKLELGATALLIVLGLVSCTVLLMRLAGYRRHQARWRRQELARLAKAALTDSLTGLGNHRAFYEDLKREITRRTKSGSFFSIVMLDLDGLKEINDTLGHNAGDERIRVLASCLAAVTDRRSSYRTGGDEFMVILPGERAWGALTFCHRLHAHVAEHPTRLRVSCGVVETTGLEGAATLVHHADLALYEAKRTGRRTIVYSAGLNPKPNRTPEDAAIKRNRQLLAATLAQAVDAKDTETRMHSETVSALCVLIGQELGLSGDRLEKLRVAGLLHDVGKIGIADELLQKRSELDDVERGAMSSHVHTGRSILAAAGMTDEAVWIYHHHERVDGTGYPDGIGGSAIPLESRIIRVADSFEAITAERRYSPARTPEEAFTELVRGVGTQFDATCVEALGRVLSSNAVFSPGPSDLTAEPSDERAAKTPQVASA